MQKIIVIVDAVLNGDNLGIQIVRGPGSETLVGFEKYIQTILINVIREAISSFLQRHECEKIEFKNEPEVTK